MNNQLEQNKLNAIAFYKTMFDGDPEKAIELYVGDEYRQHNPMVADGKAGIIEYFTRMKKEYEVCSCNSPRRFSCFTYSSNLERA